MSDPDPKHMHPNPHLHDPSTGTINGVPAGAAQEEALGVPDSGRHAGETAPTHANTPKSD